MLFNHMFIFIFFKFDNNYFKSYIEIVLIK